MTGETADGFLGFAVMPRNPSVEDGDDTAQAREISWPSQRKDSIALKGREIRDDLLELRTDY